MRFSTARFNLTISDLGQKFRMRKASACPCVDSGTGSPKPACKQCKGIGWLWGLPVEGLSGVASQKIHREWANMGLWQSGDMVLSIPSDSPIYAAGAYDRFLMLNSTEPFSVIRKRGVDDVQPVPFVSIDRVFWLTGPNQSIIEGTVPGINPDGSLSWYGLIPPSGTQYSITGRKHPEFFLFTELAQDRAHQQGLPLPRRVVIRKLDLLQRV